MKERCRLILKRFEQQQGMLRSRPSPIRWGLAAVFIWSLPFFAMPLQADDFSGKRALLLYSYHATFATSAQSLRGIRSVMQSSGLELDVEYMDSKRLYDETSRRLFREQFAYKLRHRKPYDLVFTADDNALSFMLKQGDALLPGVPVVFYGVNDIDKALAQNNNPLVTGVVEAASFGATVQLAHDLFPQRTLLQVVVDATPSGQNDLRTLQLVAAHFPELTFHTLSLAELSWADFSAALQGLNEDSLLLLLSAYRDKNNESKSFDESLAWIHRHANDVPIFHLWEHGMGQGILGGVLISHEEQGRRAAEMAARILRGEAPSALRVIDSSPNLATLDYRLLEHYGLLARRLPASVRVLFKPSTIWLKYRQEIIWISISAFFVIALLLAIIGKLNHVRAKLANSEKRYRNIVETSQEGIWLIDANGVTTFANDKLGSLFGCRAEEMLGRPMFDFMAAAERQQAQEHMERRRASIAENHEFRFLRCDGGVLWTRLTANPVFDEQGVFAGALAMVSDIGEEREALLKLRESESRFRQLAENIREVFWLSSGDWQTLYYISPAYASVWGRSCQSLLQQPQSWREALPSADAETIDKFFRACRTESWNELTFPEYRVIRPDGGVRWIAARAYAIRDKEGNIERVAGIAEDITKRKRLELVLQRSMNWEHLLNNISSAFLEANEDNFEQTLGQAIDQLGNITDTDRAYLFRINPDRQSISHIHAWCVANITAQQRQLQTPPLTPCIDLLTTIESGKAFSIPSVETLPADATPLREHLLAQGIQTLALAPLRIAGRVDGFIGVDSVQAPMPWDEDDTRMLSAVAEIIAIAIERHRAQRHLLQAQRTMQTLLGNLPGMAYQCQIDAYRTMRIVSDGVQLLTGYEPQQLLCNRDIRFIDVILPPDRALVIKAVTDAASTDQHFEIEYRIRHRNGDIRWVWEKGLRLSTADGEATIEGFISDISARRLAEASAKQADVVFDNTVEGVLVIDHKYRIIRANKAFLQTSGYDESDIIGRPLSILNSGRQDAAFYRRLWRAIGRTGRWQGEIWNRRKDGEIYPQWLSISVVDGSDGAGSAYVAIATDISEMKRNAAHFEHLAHHDPLTDLPNRLLFFSRLDHAMGRAARNGNEVALLFVDLDGFKDVNDQHGHLLGDEVLKLTAQRLKQQARRDDTVARLGGDEFVVVMEDLSQSQGARVLAEKINLALQAPMLLGDVSLSLSASIGIALFPLDAADRESLLTSADAAMYEAKTRGKNGYCFYAEIEKAE